MIPLRISHTQLPKIHVLSPEKVCAFDFSLYYLWMNAVLDNFYLYAGNEVLKLCNAKICPLWRLSPSTLCFWMRRMELRSGNYLGLFQVEKKEVYLCIYLNSRFILLENKLFDLRIESISATKKIYQTKLYCCPPFSLTFFPNTPLSITARIFHPSPYYFPNSILSPFDGEPSIFHLWISNIFRTFLTHSNR